MSIATLLAIVYIIGIICTAVMKKIQPENKIYPVWVVFVCVALTVFVGWCVSQG